MIEELPEETQNNAPGRLCIEVLTSTGRAVNVDFVSSDQTIEVWHLRQRVAVFGRAVLGRWLAEPSAWIADGLVNLTHPGRGCICVSLPDVQTHQLSAADLAGLHAMTLA